ncbi:hypothetical protein D9615_009265 [Tricholomella constricta]|uniref:Autophagy-related protein 13 n=1 Tax=Tricholomella constricta TaxID=117010 RepID=A0A8H5LW97_9AGAR|nr:hypothetical protein D9615_009265 [Tricholomella constricta]
MSVPTGVTSRSSSSISPASSASMASSESQKADQIAFHFYTKLFYVVNHARTTNPLPAKLDKWFNLETPDSELFTKEEREPYKSISLALPPPPLEIQVLLTIPELTHNQVLVHISPDSSRVRMHPTPRYVLLESFVLDFIPAHAPADVPLPTIYKHGIPLFRSLFTLLRILPAWKLHKRLRRRVGGGPSLGITLKIRTGHDPDILSLTNSESKTYTFPPVPHPMGFLALSTTYLASPTFQLDELESLLSSRFLSLDRRPFTPTLVKNHLRSSSSSASVSPPRSPPRAIRTSTSTSSGTSGIPLPLPADRQGPATASSLPRSSLGSRPSQHQPRHSLSGVPTARQTSLALTPSHPSSSSGLGIASTPPSGLSFIRAQILRQEHQHDHLTTSSSSSLSPSNSLYTSNHSATAASQDPSPARRPQYPFPFKSNTVSASTGSSPSSVAGPTVPSSLSERVALYDRERVGSLPLNPEIALTHSQSQSQSSPARGVPLPLSHARQASLSRRSSLRDSPDDPAASTASHSASGSTSSSAPRKRYSSSFGHRYAPSPAPAPPGPSPGTQPPSSSSPSSAPFHTRPSPSSPLFPARPGPTRGRTDDEDISLFVQDIDKRKPLVGRARTPVSVPVSVRPAGNDDRAKERSAERGGGGSQSREREREREREGERELEQRPRPRLRLRHEDDDNDVDEHLVAPHPIPRPFPLSAMEQQASRQQERESEGGHQVQQAQSPPGGLMLTSEAEVDVRLRRMNEAFLRSLEGLGGGRGRDREGSQSRSRESGAASGTRSGSGSGSGSRFARAVRERERARSGSGSGGWSGEPQGVFVRQGSEEVIGRMELEGDGEGEQNMRRRSGGGTGSGGRYLF